MFRGRTLESTLFRVLSVVALSFAACVAYLLYEARAAQAERLEVERASLKTRVTNVAQEVWGPAREALRRFSVRDEILSFAQQPSSPPPLPLVKPVGLAYADGIFVLNSEGEFTLQQPQSRRPVLGVPERLALVDRLTNPSETEAFVWRGGSLWVVHAHPILDPVTRQVLGVLGTVTQVDSTQIRRLERLTLTRVEVLGSGELDKGAPNDNAVTVLHPLRGLAGDTVASLEFQYPVGHLMGYTEAVIHSKTLFILFGSLLTLLVLVTLRRDLREPLMSGLEGIRSDDQSEIERMPRYPAEIGLLKETLQDIRERRDRLESLNAELERRVQVRTQELEDAYEVVILGWSRAMDSRDHETEGHTRRVAEMASRIGVAMGLTEQELTDLRRGALLHDIGKIGIPDSILLKPAKLSAEEREVMETHPILGYEMLQAIPFLQGCLCIPLHHHERWDGAGYPHQLSGHDIPLLARIFSVADVWDALRSDRPYRRGWSETDTREYIRSNAGSQFDPEVVRVFLALEPMPHPSDGDSTLFAA